MRDPYEVLGLARTASAEEIKQAYRRLARQLHPDLHPGDAKAEDRFKEVSAAHDLLSDPDKRAKYDRGEIDASGAARRRWSHGSHSHASSSYARSSGFGRSSRSGFGFGDSADDILSELLRRKNRAKAGNTYETKDEEEARKQAERQKGKDARHALAIPFVEAAIGTTRRITLVTGKALDVRIPPGAADGQALRLKGQGHPSPGGDPALAGDAYVDLKIEPHPFFTRRDLDVLLDLPVTLQEAVMGGKVTVPTVDGRVALTIPAASNTGTVLRLKGKGLPGPKGARGDQLVTLRVVLPDNDPELKKFVEKWAAKHPYDPRAKAGM